MPAFAAPTTLSGTHVRLEPLHASHAADLQEAVRDGELWQLWYTAIPSPQGMAAEITRRLDLQAKGSMCPFAVIDPATNQAVGMTTYMNIDAAN
ncbi:MAG: GNAT family N-acetyltransferase, partial [Burkholderiales bacterium]